MLINRCITCIFVLFIFLSFSLNARVKLPAFFCDNMVLQQQSGTPVWGWAKEGVNVSVITSWDKKHYNAKTDGNGKWKLKVLTPSAGGPYNIIINDGEPVVLN